MNNKLYSQLLYITSAAVRGWTIFKCPAERKAVAVVRHQLTAQIIHHRMTDFIKKYFHDTVDNVNEFNPPATDGQILQLENQLQIVLPDDYKEFLKQTNGFEGLVNEFVVDFDSTDKIYQSTQDTCAQFFPWAVYIGTNGNLEMFVIDKRHTPFQFGLLPYIADDNDFIPLGDTFEKFIQRLYNDTAFDKI